MMKNKTLRKVDGRGRLVIPKHIRDVFDIEDGYVEFYTENDLICIRRFDSAAATPAVSEDVRQFEQLKGTSPCNRCICSSCTGFGCPWVKNYSRYSYAHNSDCFTKRCFRCMSEGVPQIHDCDFYTCRKRMKFYTKRKIKVKSKYDVLIDEIREFKRILTSK